VVVKRGNLGATLANSDSRLDLPAIPVRERDAVGAGDAFTAGLLSGWLDGLDNQGLMQRACALGACAAAADGDWEGLPDRSALQMLADKDMEPLR
jgi:2-dehydro-3-deoxygluconokinase